MPLTDETFQTTGVAVIEYPADVENRVKPHVVIAFMAGESGVMTPEGPDPLYRKATKLDPDTAVKIGKALAEAGENLGGTASIAIESNMNAAAAEATAHAALRNGSPSQN